MKKYIVVANDHFELIRKLALEANQPMLAYIAEMGILECEQQLLELRKQKKR